MKDIKFATHWKEKQEQRRLYFQSLAEAARKDLDKVVQVLIQRYGIKRVILFGSLSKGKFAEGSDVDIAVEGLPRADFYEALSAVNRVTSLWIDLKPLEDLDPFFRERVLEKGQVLFSREETEYAVDTSQ
jgi:predicted nucleotidyltransferase